MGTFLALALIIAQAQTSGAAPQAALPSAAAAFAGRTIVRVDVAVEGRITEDPMLRDLIQTRVGTPLTMTSVRQTIAHLYSLGRFQEISVDAAPLDSGVALRYDVVPVHTVQRIEFKGNLGLSESELRRAVASRFGPAPPESRASAVAEMLQGYYFDHGYLAAAIRPLIEERHDPEVTILIFEIDAGVQASVRNVDLAGDPLQPRDRFLERIHASPGRPYVRVDVQQRLNDYVESLRRGGRYEARGNHRIVTQSDDGRSVDIAVTIEPGPEVQVRFEGDPLPKERIQELVPVQREGSADTDILEDSERRIVAFYNEQGYWKATARATRQELDGRIAIVFNVRKGALYRVVEPKVIGNAAVPAAEIQPLLANFQDGDVFVARHLDAAVSAIRGIYLRRGYAQVKVESAANERNPSPTGEGRVQPVIVISEGPLVQMGEITFSGNKAVTNEELSRHLSIAPGQPYYEPRVIEDREKITTEYLNRGFEQVSVKVTPVMQEGSRVDLRFDVSEGPQSIVDHILIVGNVKTDPRVIEREVQLKVGQPLGLHELFETRRRLGGLGLFRRIRIDQIPHGESNLRDILITVEEAPATTIGYGGGLELSKRLTSDPQGEAQETYDLAPRGFFEISRRNIFGRNRIASLFTRLALRSDEDGQGGGGQFGFPEYRIVGTYREPSTFGSNADVTITGLVEQGVRSTFKFARRGVNAEVLRRLTPTIRVSGRYTFGTTRTFDEALTPVEQATIDRVFPRVRLSGFTGTIARDTRDDALDPTRGTFITADGTVAARALGGQVGYLKSYVEAHAYRVLPIGRRVVFAARVAVGLADGFPREAVDEAGQTELIEDLPASERFYAGGDTTMRGFALDSVGAPNTISSTGFPIGGNGLVLLNGEVRVPVWKALGAAVFVDSGNVFERVTQIDMSELRASMGIGLRYRTPVGPLRLDMGFKLGSLRPEDKRRYALHFSFGQAF